MPLFGGNKKKPEMPTRPPEPRPRLNLIEPRIERINWLGLKVADVTGEALFLEEKLNLKFLNEGNSASGHHVLYDCGTLQLELVEGGQTWASRSKPRLGSPDIPLIGSFTVDKIEEVVNRFSEAEILSTQVFDQGWVASLLFFDLERNLWQVSEIRNEPAIGFSDLRRIGAVWLAAEDLEAQITFYKDVLGLPLSDKDDRPRPITEQAEHQQADAELAEGANLEFEPEPAADNFSPPSPTEACDEIVTLKEGTSVTFFNSGARLALTGGGHRLEGGKERQWGRDTSFMLGFQTNDLNGMAERLRQAGVRIQGPDYLNRYSTLHRNRAAIRFTDPEGNTWQITQ
jgi:catechol 2,3-dioxygenase-like lactoylglutathione lyase family enzyme